MSRVKLGLLGVLATIAVSAISVSAASAAFTLTSTECNAGTVIAFCYATTEKGTTLLEFSGEEEILGTAGNTLLEAKFGEENVHIECTASTIEGGLLLQPSPLVKVPTFDASSLHFTGCTLLETLGKKCKVPAELLTKPIVGTPETTEDIVFAPETPPIFIEIEFSNNGTETCPVTIRGVRKVTGEELCNLLGNGEAGTTAETDLKLHILACPEEAGKLKFAENPAQFHAEYDIELDNATTDFWSLSKA
jgi:hypothetical protein